MENNHVINREINFQTLRRIFIIDSFINSRARPTKGGKR